MTFGKCLLNLPGAWHVKSRHIFVCVDVISEAEIFLPDPALFFFYKMQNVGF